jgi:hypothetical protein
MKDVSNADFVNKKKQHLFSGNYPRPVFRTGLQADTI